MSRNILTYLASTFLFSWILWIPSVLEYFGIISLGSEELSNAIYFIALIIGAFAPAFGSFMALRSENKSFKEHLKKCFSRKGINRWGLFLSIIFILPLLINGLSHLIGWIFGLSLPPSPLPSDPWFIPYLLYIPYIVFVSVLGGGQEEIGWRGYLQGQLLKKYSPITTSLIIGAIWGIWHTPLWFMLWDSHNITPYLGFILMTMFTSLIYSYIYQKAKGNILIMILLHGNFNAAFVIFYMFYDDQPASAQPLYWIYVGISILGGLIACLLFIRDKTNQTLMTKED
ncbi:hypothetical protein NEF87_000273 [Candidatus Lokiarchaeum ossiferum]|uniref:CAAX prenyl protease 2/Lysostaphin resistance protein A-like domain-containing protein n=1 Tax=Candidatus Lokiarchaeum ossiferum TaxID=2951803 RepID=A0ABY6HKE2_9ARCH|nr:hypothetical protein NEF87_000273 [Candidatus Lokiarchaeum sp. B-35]